MHSLGYLHLDIKPENILLGSDISKSRENATLYLIDFGISKKFILSNGDHIPSKDGIEFSGNLVFASKTAFEEKCKIFINFILFRIK